MIQLAEGVSPPKVRPRKAVKPSKGPAVSKQKLTLYVSVETAQRLAVHATMTGVDRSALVEGLIRDHCKRFVVQDRGGMSDAATLTVSGT